MNRAQLTKTLAATVALLCAAPCTAQARPPAHVQGQWQCMRSVNSGDPFQSMFTFAVRPGNVWTDLTFAPSQARNARYTYSRGVLRLLGPRGTLLHTLRWTPPGEGGTSERLVELLPANHPQSYTRSGEVCTRRGASSARSAAPRPAAGTKRSDPFNPHSTDRNWPGWFAQVQYSPNDEPLYPRETVIRFTLTPSRGGPALTFTRTVDALLTPAAPSERRPLEQTYFLPDISFGTYRVSATATLPGGAQRRMRLKQGAYADAGTEIDFTLEAGDRTATLPNNTLYMMHP